MCGATTTYPCDARLESVVPYPSGAVNQPWPKPRSAAGAAERSNGVSIPARVAGYHTLAEKSCRLRVSRVTFV